MSFLKNIFSKKDIAISTYEDFWNWFAANEKAFFNAIKQKSNIEKEVLDILSPKLAELQNDFYFVVGMYEDLTAELVITADGSIANGGGGGGGGGGAPGGPGGRGAARGPAGGI